MPLNASSVYPLQRCRLRLLLRASPLAYAQIASEQQPGSLPLYRQHSVYLIEKTAKSVSFAVFSHYWPAAVPQDKFSPQEGPYTRKNHLRCNGCQQKPRQLGQHGNARAVQGAHHAIGHTQQHKHAKGRSQQ